MKKMSPREQLELLRKRRKRLRDLSMKGKMMAAQQDAQEQDAQEQDTQEQILKRATRISIYDRYVR